MYTQCLHCRSVLAIRAEAIRLGRGRARCGHCLEEFDIWDTLSDTLAEFVNDRDPSSSNNDAIRVLHCPPDAESTPPSNRVEVKTRADDAVGTGSLVPQSAAVLVVPSRAHSEQPANAREISATTEERVPEVLREAFEEESGRRSNGTRRWAFTAGSVMLALLLAGQGMWFFSRTLGERYPALLPVLTSFCHYSGCDLAKRRDPTRIEMVSRDVRVHPDYEGALRVIAMMVNQLPYSQPYPQMRFTLFNVNGDIIAGRTFRPDEYLASSVDVSAGMPSRVPVQIALDLLALEEAAVSFEFRFL